MPLMPSKLDRSEGSLSIPMPNDYHTYTFQHLFTQYPDQIKSALIDTGLEFRRKKLRSRVKDKKPSDHYQSWDLLRPYLDDLEGEIARIANRHSRVYWFHLYRRLAPILSSNHDGKTDSLTAVLVRKIADQAFVRYGSSRIDDLVPISEKNPENLLGGYFAASVATFNPIAPKVLFDYFAQSQRWVLGQFQLNDFLEIHRLESLFYEYWRTMATLRKIGKGVVGLWADRVNWFEYDRGVNPELFSRYDEENYGPGGFQTLLGTWHPQRQRSDDGLFFAWAQYNSKNIYADRSGNARNFEVGLESLSHFWASNAFLAEAFYKTHGVRLDALMYLLCAFSASAVIPTRFVGRAATEADIKAIFDANSLNLEFRAYVIRTSSKDVIIREALEIAGFLDKNTAQPSQNEIEKSFDFLCFDETKTNTVSLWAGGRKYPIIRYGDNYLFDIAAVTDWIEGLFFGVRQGVGVKGYRFEDVFRQYLRDRGVDIIHHGEINWADGSVREADAIARVGDTAIIVECVAAERPVDFEIAEPRRFAKRKDILTAKAKQARTLAEKLQKEPTANNLDLSWANKVIWVVVSHLPEFLWTEDFPCYAGTRQCIMHPISVADWLTGLAS